MNATQENRVLETQNKSELALLEAHPFVDAVYRRFKRGGLDAVNFESEAEKAFRWQVESSGGYMITHFLYHKEENDKVEFRSVVVLGQVPLHELEKAKREIIKMNVEMPCLYLFAIDSDRLVLLQMTDLAENISPGSYRSLLDGMINWADRSCDCLKSSGITIQPKARIKSEPKEEKAG